MARKFLSFLGAGSFSNGKGYFDSKYRVKDKIIQTNFVQEALIKGLCGDWTKNDCAVIFLTKLARETNWENPNNKNGRLKDKLNKLNINIVEVDICDGRNDDEIYEIYTKIYDSLDENDEIIFDITHGFRSIPMLALTVLNYAKVLKNIKIKGIYYGAFDAKDEEGVTPVFNLSVYDEILEWSQAVNSFLKYGNSQHIKEIVDLMNRKHIKDGDKSYIPVRDFADSLNDFTNSIYTCRGKVTDEFINKSGSNRKSISAAYSRMKEKLDDVVKNDDKSIKPLVPLFEKIKDRTCEFSNSDNLKTWLAVIRWCIDNNLTQQAYTALEETVTTYVCKKFNLDETDADIRMNVATPAIRIKEKITEGKKISLEKWGVKEEYKDKVSYIVENIDDDLVKLTVSIGSMRNDINHFGFTKNTMNYDDLNRNIAELYKKFLEYIDRDSKE